MVTYSVDDETGISEDLANRLNEPGDKETTLELNINDLMGGRVYVFTATVLEKEEFG